MPPSSPDPERFDTDGVTVNATSLPAMFAVGWLLGLLHLWFALGYLFHSTYHEFGHTFTAWLSGRYAFPIPILLTIVGNDRSTALSAVTLAPLALGASWAARERRFVLAAVLASIAALGLYLSFVASETESRVWVTFGGCAGEFVLSALVCAAFYVELPDRLRWDFWRWPFVFVACCVLVNADRTWRGVASDLDRLPRGTAMAGSKDANGDMDKLLRAGWTPAEIAGDYLALADAAWLGLGVLYGARVLQAVRRSRS